MLDPLLNFSNIMQFIQIFNYQVIKIYKRDIRGHILFYKVWASVGTVLSIIMARLVIDVKFRYC